MTTSVGPAHPKLNWLWKQQTYKNTCTWIASQMLLLVRSCMLLLHLLLLLVDVVLVGVAAFVIVFSCWPWWRWWRWQCAHVICTFVSAYMELRMGTNTGTAGNGNGHGDGGRDRDKHGYSQSSRECEYLISMPFDSIALQWDWQWSLRCYRYCYDGADLLSAYQSNLFYRCYCHLYAATE